MKDAKTAKRPHFVHFGQIPCEKRAKKGLQGVPLAPCEDAGFGDAFEKGSQPCQALLFQQDIMNISPNLSNLMKANVHIGHHVRRTIPT